MKSLLFLLTFVAMTLTVPWFFPAGTSVTDALPVDPAAPPALPDWVVFAMAASVGYAVVVAACIQFFWETSAAGDEEVSGMPVESGPDREENG